MKVIKKILALALVAMLGLSMTACHKKDEIAVKIGDVEFTSAYYMCALVFANTEARSIVDKDVGETDKEIDYFSHKVEKTEYVKWVKEKALKMLKDIAAYKTLCKEAGIELEEDAVSNAKMYASYYWSNYGYSAAFEPNGVSQGTFTQYMVDGNYSARYFEYLYGEGGKKELAADTVKQTITDNYVLADKLEVSFSNKEEADIAAEKEKFNAYVTALNNGSKTFDQVYHEQNGDEHTEDTAEDTEEETEETTKPVNSHASVLGTADTQYASDQYEDAKAMAVGEVKLVELADNGGLVLLVKRDLEADPYYMENLDIAARHTLADEEYEKDIEDYAKKLDTKTHSYAINQFKVKKIVVPESQS